MVKKEAVKNSIYMGAESRSKLKDYHDYYSFKEGKFIADFNTMYAECNDPWFQIEKAGTSYSRWSTIQTIKSYGLKNVLKVGCDLDILQN